MEQGIGENGRQRWFALRTRPNVALGLMLLALHGALVLGVESGAAKGLLLAHFGLFLLWQPVWQGAGEPLATRSLLIILGGVVLALWSNWWLIGLWVALLFSLIGANLPSLRLRSQRLAPLLAALYLLSILLVWVVPHLLRVFDSQPLVEMMVRYIFSFPLLVILVLPAAALGDGPRYAVDLFYSFLLFLLAMVLVLGAIFVQQINQSSYALALAQTVLAIAGVILLLSWLWDARGGFDGLGQLLSRYFLSLGMPFEQWMYRLANLAESEPDADNFVAGAATEIVGLPWVSGVDWRTAARGGTAGNRSLHATAFQFRGLGLTIFTRWQPGPGMLVHMRLLARLLGDYYDAKLREQTQRNTAYLQAIYETGSRVTHDVKNLLQSLRSLCAAADSGTVADAEALRRLMQRQLPQIAQRLQSTLDKLETRRTTSPEQQPAADWWRSLMQRYGHEGMEFTASSLERGGSLAADLFDSVADNLLQNALQKRRLGETRRIAVDLQALPQGGFRLRVSDGGTSIEADLAARLFSAPVSSESGLGVGLYQAARQAADQGYAIRLADNRAGAVTFVLEPAAAAAAS